MISKHPICDDLFCFAERQAEELGEYHSPSLVRDFSWAIFSFGVAFMAWFCFFLLGKEEVANAELISETLFSFALYGFLCYSL